MKRLFKKFVTLVLAAAMLTSSAAVFAQDEMTNMDYVGVDTSDMLNPCYVYNEMINGKFTGKQILVKVKDNEMKWVTNSDCFEREYPYAGYSWLHVINPETKAWDNTWVTAYNNLTPQWQTQREDWIFQFNTPYKVIERQRTLTPWGWQWDFGNEKFKIDDSLLNQYTGRNAKDVVNTWSDYFFARNDVDGTMLDAYKTLKDIHCDKCVDYTYYCNDCNEALPIEYWSKADAEKYALLIHFNVLGDATYGNGFSGNEVKFTPEEFLKDVQYVRACQAHVKNCKSAECEEKIAKGTPDEKPIHVPLLTLTNVLEFKYDIVGFDEIMAYVITPANVAARGTIVQEKIYPRAKFGNLLTNEGTNRYYLSDDILEEIIPKVVARTISGRFVEGGTLHTYYLPDQYIQSEIAYESKKMGCQVDFPEYVYGSDEATRLEVKAKRLGYFKALVDDDTAWEWFKYESDVIAAFDDIKVVTNVNNALDVVTGADIAWTTPNFEAAPPHRYYQYMIMDGVVLDGTNNKPLVWRYTGANADPKVEWKLDSFTTVIPNNVEKNTLGLYAAVERLYVNGAKTDYTRLPAVVFNVNTIADWTIHNEAKLDYAYAYFKTAEDGKYIDYYITDNNGINILVYRQVNHGTLVKNNINPNIKEPKKPDVGQAEINAPTIATVFKAP